jgi:TolA-binding protein
MLVAACVIGGAAAATTYVVNHGVVGFAQKPEAQNVAQNPTPREKQSVLVQVDSALPTATPALALTTQDVTQTPRSSATNHVARVADHDAAFADAWAELRAKRPAEAAKHFDSLLASDNLDPARRADVLYWSAQSHRQAGEVSAAMSRSSQVLRQYPASHHASDAALILGEYALASDQFDVAAQYLNQAAQSERSVVRERAQRALRELVRKQSR